MKIIKNDIGEQSGIDNTDSVWLRLSNGDSVRVYDNLRGYGAVEVVRHDDDYKSEVTSKSPRPHMLGRTKRFRKTIVKRRELDISNSSSDRMSIEITHFYPRSHTKW